MPTKLPIITLMPPDHCANCKTSWVNDDGSSKRFTLFGTPEHLKWLCNPCFIKLATLEKEEQNKLIDVKLRPNDNT